MTKTFIKVGGYIEFEHGVNMDMQDELVVAFLQKVEELGGAAVTSWRLMTQEEFEADTTEAVEDAAEELADYLTELGGGGEG